MDFRSQTALQIAVRLKKEDMVHTLLGIDAVEVNVRNNKLNTPLHHAVRECNETIIRIWLRHGADISVENSHKRTPKDLAEKHKSRMHIAKLLRSRLVPGPDQRLSAQRIGTGAPPASKEGQLAYKNFQITVTEIYASRGSDKHWSVSISVEALLYGQATLNDILKQVRPKEAIVKVPVCTWIHVPENNVRTTSIRCSLGRLTLAR
jgi:ankyrin repeat protein